MSSQASPTETADAVKAAVLAVPGVVGLHGGAFGEVATYFPGRTVQGVRVRPESTAVHLVLAWNAPAQATAALVREAVTSITRTPVDIVVADVAEPAGLSPIQGP
ncbi:MAG: hypothetical protein ACKOVB_13130 [Terrabacter sp.]